ncbi:MAG TPA: glycosyltransferase, partial [Candidatus Glassbacteria bacterium]|nr:glycosyltransferase [Candidatus Glassbacteria bacterium]
LDVPKLLSEVSISVLPSLSEGLSNVLLESMAAGVPVIATKVGGTPEVIEDGVSGLLVPPSDSEALARAMRSLIENPELARRYGQAGKQRIAEHFSLGRMVQQTEQHYLNLLEQTKQFPNLSRESLPRALSRAKPGEQSRGEGADKEQACSATEAQA